MNNVSPRPAASIPPARRSLRAAEAPQSIDDQYLASLATGNFSSPSLPPLSNLPSPTALSPFSRSSWTVAGQEMPPPAARRRPSNRVGAVDLPKREPDFGTTNPSVDPSIPPATMPPTTRRRSLASGTDPAVRKRRPSAATSPSNRPSKARRKAPLAGHNNESSPFDDDVDDDLNGLGGKGGSETIDLSNATEVPVELLAPKVDNRVKIGKFQCVICMDDTTALTVTHCGMCLQIRLRLLPHFPRSRPLTYDSRTSLLLRVFTFFLAY